MDKFRDPDTISDERLAELGIDRAAFKALVSEMIAREVNVPRVGTRAPDFELPYLSPEGEPTGAHFRLSGALGTPVALVFGSYT